MHDYGEPSDTELNIVEKEGRVVDIEIRDLRLSEVQGEFRKIFRPELQCEVVLMAKS